MKNQEPNDITPTIQIEVVWHPDFVAGEEFASTLFKALSMDADRPIELRPSLPVRFWTRPNHELIPIAAKQSTSRVAIIVLMDDSMLQSQEWGKWLSELSSAAHREVETVSPSVRILPVAMRHDIYANVQLLGQMNFLAHESNLAPDSQYLVNQILISLLHFLVKDKLYYDVFLSYSRSDGAEVRDFILERFKRYPYLRPFVDEHDLIVGALYRERFRSIIRSSVFVAIQTDTYSSRTESVREFEYAKQIQRPIIVVDALVDGEPRSSSYMGNTRVLRYSSADKTERLVTAILTEVLCFELFDLEVDRFRQAGNEQVTVSRRAPDLHYLATSRRNKLAHRKSRSPNVCLYPDPPLSHPELASLKAFESNTLFLTPVQYLSSQVLLESTNRIRSTSLPLQGLEVQLSVSPPGQLQLEAEGKRAGHVEQCLIEFARYLVASGATVVFGGKFSSKSVGSWIMRIVESYGRAEGPRQTSLRAYMPFPVALGLDPVERRELSKHIDIIPLTAPDDVRGLTKDGRQMPRLEGSKEWKYTWARSLTEARRTMAEKTHVTILIGGKENGFLGRFPGLVEEAFFAITQSNPLFVVGCLGGCARSIYNAIYKKNTWNKIAAFKAYSPEWTTEDFLKLAKSHNVEQADVLVDYKPLRNAIYGSSNRLAKNGLTKEENLRLGDSQDYLECIHLVLKGLTAVNQLRSVSR